MGTLRKHTDPTWVGMLPEKGSSWSVKRTMRPAAAGCQLWWPASASRRRCLASRRSERRRSSALIPPVPPLPSAASCEPASPRRTVARQPYSHMCMTKTPIPFIIRSLETNTQTTAMGWGH